MKKRTLINIALAVLVLIPIFVWFQGWAWERNMKKQGDVIVEKVELFRLEHGRLPENLREMGLPESEAGPLYYDKTRDGQSYMVSFGTTLGESTIYRSDTKKWE